MWDTCKNTEKSLIIIKTDYGKIIGGYLPCKVQQSGGLYFKNSEGFRFYFS